jgi:hypothetical protein
MPLCFAGSRELDVGDRYDLSRKLDPALGRCLREIGRHLKVENGSVEFLVTSRVSLLWLLGPASG